MRQDYIDSMSKAISGNFQSVAESLEDARKLVEEGKNELASRELRVMIDGIVQTLEIMSIADLIQNDILLEDLNRDE